MTYIIASKIHFKDSHSYNPITLVTDIYGNDHIISKERICIKGDNFYYQENSGKFYPYSKRNSPEFGGKYIRFKNNGKQFIVPLDVKINVENNIIDFGPIPGFKGYQKPEQSSFKVGKKYLDSNAKSYIDPLIGLWLIINEIDNSKYIVGYNEINNLVRLINKETGRFKDQSHIFLTEEYKEKSYLNFILTRNDKGELLARFPSDNDEHKKLEDSLTVQGLVFQNVTVELEI